MEKHSRSFPCLEPHPEKVRHPLESSSSRCPLKHIRIGRAFARWMTPALLWLMLSCNRAPGPDWDALLARYAARPEDSLKLEAAQFLRQHWAQQSSWEHTLRTASGQAYPVNFDTVRGEAGLNELMSSNSIEFSRQEIPDSESLTEEMLTSHIDSYDFYMRNWEWNRLADRRTVLNYLLAYKVFNEQPGNWREYFFRLHLSYTRKVLASFRFGRANRDNPTTHALSLLDMARNWATYDAGPRELAGPVPFPLMKCLRKGDCYFYAYTGVYVLRSFGIPAALDYVPCWGSKNGSHAEVAALDTAGKISAIPRHELKYAAKVFRFSFIPARIWSDSIRPYMGKDSFLLEGIAHDHWTDATADHTGVADVELAVPAAGDKRIIYLCAFNYGNWQPVFWGRADNRSTVNFRNMGTGILYCAAIPENNGFRLTGRPFLLNEEGRPKYFEPDPGHVQSMQLSKLNTGERSWVECGKTYALYRLDTTGDWQLISEIACRKDSLLTAINVPAGGIYRLVDKRGDGRLERPFRYDARQVWL